jgi:DNA-binding response OmpR family regulator
MSASRVLVIDDSTTLRKLVEIAMRGTGMDIDFAATGSDGVVRARSARPDVILLDYLLPDLESTEVCQLLSDDTSTAKVPVVVMSANQSDVFESFRRFPAVVDFVGKPFSPSEIRTRL